MISATHLIASAIPLASSKAGKQRKRLLSERSGSNRRPDADKQGLASLEAIDPLYGKVYVEHPGRFLVGAVRFKDGKAAKRIVEQVRKRMGVEEK